MSVEETPRTFRTNVVRTKQYNFVHVVSCSEDGGVPYIGETKQCMRNDGGQTALQARLGQTKTKDKMF